MLPTPDPTPASDGPSGPPPARTAVVTGAGRGLGRHVAAALAADGIAVGLLGRRREPLEALAAELAARGPGPAPVVATADVRDHAQVVDAVAVLEERLGGIGLLVNNAGVIEAEEVPVWEADPAEWRRVVETDLLGPFHCVRAVVPGMIARGGGRVIDLNSGAGAADRPVYSAYCAAKAGLFRIGGSLHLAGFDRGIRAFELAPGVVRTDMTAGMPMHDDRLEWTDPDDVIELVLAMARGDLDAWSGAYLRAGVDTPPALAAAAAVGRATSPSRRLGVIPWGVSDPLG